MKPLFTQNGIQVEFDRTTGRTKIGNYETTDIITRNNLRYIYGKSVIAATHNLQLEIMDSNGMMPAGVNDAYGNSRRHHHHFWNSVFLGNLGNSFANRLLGASYSYWIRENEEVIDLVSFINRGRVTPHWAGQIHRYYKHKALIDGAFGKDPDSTLCLITYFCASSDEMQVVLGAPLWVALCKNSISRNKLLIRLLDDFIRPKGSGFRCDRKPRITPFPSDELAKIKKALLLLSSLKSSLLHAMARNVVDIEIVDSSVSKASASKLEWLNVNSKVSKDSALSTDQSDYQQVVQLAYERNIELPTPISREYVAATIQQIYRDNIRDSYSVAAYRWFNDCTALFRKYQHWGAKISVIKSDRDLYELKFGLFGQSPSLIGHNWDGHLTFSILTTIGDTSHYFSYRVIARRNSRRPIQLKLIDTSLLLDVIVVNGISVHSLIGRLSNPHAKIAKRLMQCSKRELSSILRAYTPKNLTPKMISPRDYFMVL